MAKGKRTKWQKWTTQHYTEVNSGAPEEWAVPVPLVTSVVLILWNPDDERIIHRPWEVIAQQFPCSGRAKVTRLPQLCIHLCNNIIHEIFHGSILWYVAHSTWGSCCLTVTRRVLLVVQELLFCVVFWNPLSIRPFSVGHCIVSLSSVLWSIVWHFLYFLLAIVSSLFLQLMASY